MKLPYGEATELEQIIRKLDTYSLNTQHNKGKHKARIFRAKLGITIENKQLLAEALMNAAARCEAKPKNIDMHGEQYVIDFPLTTSVGSSVVRSIWIVRLEEKHPRLVSVYPYKNIEE